MAFRLTRKIANIYSRLSPKYCLGRLFCDGSRISRFPVPKVSSLPDDLRERLITEKEKVKYIHKYLLYVQCSEYDMNLQYSLK